MSDDRRAGPSGSRYSSRKRTKKPKPEVVELSDSSSDCIDEVRESCAREEKLVKIKIKISKKAYARKAGSKCLSRKQIKKTKSIVIELTDSSSEFSSDYDDVPHAAASAPPSLKSTPQPSNSPTLECPVCLQPCMHPARLPCGHIFCFLCLKGIAQQSHRCAMCRQEISSDYLDRPDLLQVEADTVEKETQDDEYQWFYEGRNGWWKFEERLSQDLEEVHRLGLDRLETLICGDLYVIDLQALVQYNKNHPGRRRKVKRERACNVVVKGVAGIR